MTEYFDVLTESGTSTGESLPRDEVHNRGLWHGSVHVWIINGRGEFLLQQRALTKKTDPGLWDISVCGHISAGDDAVTTAVREAKEELGLSLDPAGFEQLYVYIRTNPPVPGDANGVGAHPYPERLVSPTLLIRAEIDLDSLRLEPTEVTAVRWITLDELHTHLLNPPHPTSPKASRGKLQFSIRPAEWTELFPLLKNRLG